MGNEAVFKEVVQYWKQCAIVSYAERVEMKEKAPTRMKIIDTDGANKKPHPRKEIQDLLKFLKSLCKQATKRTGQFLKNLEKKEGKETKREGLNKQYDDTEDWMNKELKRARDFANAQGLFDRKYMIGSKLGDAAPKQRILIVLELSDKLATFVDEAKEEVRRLLYEVINPDENTTTLNIGLFG